MPLLQQELPLPLRLRLGLLLHLPVLQHSSRSSCSSWQLLCPAACAEGQPVSQWRQPVAASSAGSACCAHSLRSCSCPSPPPSPPPLLLPALALPLQALQWQALQQEELQALQQQQLA